ncbi:WAT1-related protein [Capsicum galapagoense]
MEFENYKPTIVMIVMQFIYAANTLFCRGALVQGLSARVFVVYRQAIGFLLIAPIAFGPRRKTDSICLGWKSFWLIFLASLIGVTINQNIYFSGLYYSSSSIASATSNLVPAFTFLMAWVMGLEKVQMKSLRSIAKVIGTILCVAGAIAMALIKGPKLLNSEFIPTNGLLLLTLGKENNYENLDSNWMFGVILLIASAICWSLWLILQVTLSENCPDHISLTAWLCLFAAIQSAIVTFFIEPHINTWKITSSLELISCLFTGFASAVTFFGQAWCISKRDPLFSAMFNPLNTVIVTVFASIFMHEEMYTGSLVGSLAVIFGLYVVLWGKAKDKKEENIIAEEEPMKQNNIQETTIIIQDSNNSDLITSCKIDLEEPLLIKKSTSHEDDK